MLSDLSSEFFSWIRGALFALSIFHMFLYFNNKQKFFLFYAAFCFLAFINLTLLKVFNYNNQTVLFLSLPLQHLILYCYFYYSREVLKTKELLPDWDQFIKKAAVVLFVISLLIFFLHYFIPNYIIYGFYILLLFLASYYIFITYFRIKDKVRTLSLLFLVSVFSLLILGSLTFFVPVFKTEIRLLNFQVHYQSFLYFGIMIEMIVTAIVLGFRINTMEKDDELIHLKLAKQTAETEALRMETLKSQMNPHFIFNMLNSINSLIIKNDTEKASDYITKFARFIREILNSSRKNSMSLADELKTIKLYVVLEQARLEGGFDYEVQIEDNLSTDFIQIPSMFLQPFVENAIWHGLAHKNGDKKLTIKLSKKDNYYFLDVIDNGIGYQKGLEIAQKRLVKSSGIAVEIVKNRLQSLYKNGTTDVIVKDISDEKSSGTKVTFKFPC